MLHEPVADGSIRIESPHYELAADATEPSRLGGLGHGTSLPASDGRNGVSQGALASAP